VSDTFTWASFALARSAAHAALGDVFGREWQRLTLDQSSRLITDLIDMADTEGWTDLYKAAQELFARVVVDAGEIEPGITGRYVDALLAGDSRRV
jgi:hypothetical protein